MKTTLPAPLDDIEHHSWQIGVVATAVLLVGLWLQPAQCFRSYLVACLFILSIPIGCLAMAMIHVLVGGEWGLMIRRLQGAAFSTLPLVLVLWLPLLAGLAELYPWARPGELTADPVLRRRAWVYNVPFFLGRTGVCFAVWIICADLFGRWTERYDRAPHAALGARIQKLSAAGILFQILTLSIFAIDWIMSREAHWYSTVLGFIVIVGQVLAGFAFTILLLTHLMAVPPLAGIVRPSHLNDLGTLLFALVILSAYLNFSQYLIIWSGHIQEEITWYVVRGSDGWMWIGALLIVFHFFVPFFLLLSRRAKQTPSQLGAIAALLLLMRALDLLWMIAPSDLNGIRGSLYWTDLVALPAVGGIWLKAYLWNLRRRPLLMQRQPGVEVAAHEQLAGATG